MLNHIKRRQTNRTFTLILTSRISKIFTKKCPLSAVWFLCVPGIVWSKDYIFLWVPGVLWSNDFQFFECLVLYVQEFLLIFQVPGVVWSKDFLFLVCLVFLWSRNFLYFECLVLYGPRIFYFRCACYFYGHRIYF